MYVLVLLGLISLVSLDHDDLCKEFAPVHHDPRVLFLISDCSVNSPLPKVGCFNVVACVYLEATGKGLLCMFLCQRYSTRVCL